MDYTDIYDLTVAYTENTETSFLANIPNFVKLTEEAIYRAVDLPFQTKVSVSLMSTPHVNSVTLPSDFLTFDYMFVVGVDGKYNMLLNKEVDYIYQAYGDPTYEAMPEYYSLQNNNTVVFGPTPDRAYDFHMQYENKPDSIVDTGTSWVGDNCENALLYGTLVNAYTYMKGEDTLLASYKQMFSDAIGVAKSMAETWEHTDTYRNQRPRDLDVG